MFTDPIFSEGFAKRYTRPGQAGSKVMLLPVCRRSPFTTGGLRGGLTAHGRRGNQGGRGARRPRPLASLPSFSHSVSSATTTGLSNAWRFSFSGVTVHINPSRIFLFKRLFLSDFIQNTCLPCFLQSLKLGQWQLLSILRFWCFSFSGVTMPITSASWILFKTSVLFFNGL